MKVSTSIENYLNIYPSGKNEAHMVVWMDEYFKLPLFGLGEVFEKWEEEVEDSYVVIQKWRP